MERPLTFMTVSLQLVVFVALFIIFLTLFLLYVDKHNMLSYTVG